MPKHEYPRLGNAPGGRFVTLRDIYTLGDLRQALEGFTDELQLVRLRNGQYEPAYFTVEIDVRKGSRLIIS